MSTPSHLPPPPLVGLERYNPEHLDSLEEFAFAMSELGVPYSRDAALALFKLYQFNPDCANTEAITKILTKAITQLPENDTTLLLAMLDEEQHNKPEIQAVIEMLALLREASYKEFWRYTKDDPNAKMNVESCKGFTEQIKQYIGNMIRFTHTRIPLEHLKEALNGDIAGWKVEGDVAIIQDKDNRKTPFKTAERLDIKDLRGIIIDSIRA